jgi:YbbR domain-containing protein
MNLITNNWHLKILALLAAILLWFFVVGIENTVYLFPEEIEVKVSNLDKSIGLAASLPSIKVYIKADQDTIKTLNKSNFHPYVDLSGLTQGEYSLPVHVSSDNPQVTILKTVPDRVAVRLAPIAEKEVPINVTSNGIPKTGYSLKEIKVETKTAKVSAPQNLLDKIESVNAEVLLDGTETNEINKNVVLTVSAINGLPKDSIKINPEQIIAIVVIGREQFEKTVKIVPQFTELGNSEEFIKSSIINPTEVKVLGTVEVLSRITEIQTEPVSVEYISGKTFPVEVKVILPEGITFLNPNQKITIFLDKGINIQKVVMVPITIEGEKSSKVKIITPAEIKVTLSGASGIINALAQGDVSIKLSSEDMENAGSLKISSDKITIPQGVEIINFEPAEVKLTF